MARSHWFVVAGLIALGHQGTARAFWPACLKPRPIDTPPPLSPYNPAPSPTNPDPKSETPPATSTNPQVNPAPAPRPPVADQLAGNDFLGGQAADTLSPNMFGDFFGGAGRSRLTLNGSPQKINVTGTATFSPARLVEGSGFPGAGSVARFDPNATGAFVSLLANRGGSTTLGPAGLTPFTQTITQVNFTVSPQTTDIYAQVVNRLNQTPAGRQALLAALNRAYGSPNNTTLTGFDSLILGRTGRAVSRTSTSGDLVYDYQVAATALRTVPYELGLALANPTSGGTVGRTKVSEDNNPFPRDRVIFNYDYYSATQLSADGTNVNRFSFGAEKTFFDRQASIEVRVPVASSLANTVIVDGVSGRDVEFGNVAITGKWLLTRDPVLNFTTGMSIALPTAADSVARLAGGGELVRIKNESVLLTPYVASMYTPNDRLFMQTWLSAGVDPFGNDLRFRNTGDGTTQTRRIHDVTTVSFDTQLGYWIARGNDPDELIQGLAPFVELHYNRGIGAGDQSASFGGVNVLTTRGNFNDINLTLGFTAQLLNNIYVTNGLVLPLGDSNNRFFEWQYGLRLNWLYGPTARANEAALNALRPQMAGR